MTNIIKKDNGRQATFGSVVDQLFHQNFQRFLDDDFWGFNGLSTRVGAPVNLRETDQSFELELIAPGLQKQDLQISFTGDTLTLSYQHKEENNESKQGHRWVRQEYRKASFSRSFQINDTIDTDKAAARYENGILYLTLPKREPAQPASRIIDVQ